MTIRVNVEATREWLKSTLAKEVSPHDVEKSLWECAEKLRFVVFYAKVQNRPIEVADQTGRVDLRSTELLLRRMKELLQ